MASSSTIKIPGTLPLLLMREVLLPCSTIRVRVDSARNMQLARSLLEDGTSLNNTYIGVIPNIKDPEQDSDELLSLQSIGTAGLPFEVAAGNSPKLHYTMYITGVCRFRVSGMVSETPFTLAVVEQLDRLEQYTEGQPLDGSLGELSQKLYQGAMQLLEMFDDPVSAQMLKRWIHSLPREALPDQLASMIKISNTEKLQVLKAVDLEKRFKKILPLVTRRIKQLQEVHKHKPAYDLVEVSTVQAEPEEQGRSRLREKQEQCLQLEASLKEIREKLLAVEQKNDTLKSQAKKAETELAELRLGRGQAQKTQQTQQQQISELEKRNKELSHQMSTEKQGATALQVELQIKSSALGDSQKHAEKLEQEQSDLRTRLDILTKEGQKQKAELEKKLQEMSTENQKSQQEKDTQAEELQKVKEALNKASTSLKESRSQVEKEKKNSAVALEEKEKTHQKTQQEFQKCAAATAKELGTVKAQLAKMIEAETKLQTQLKEQSNQLKQAQDALGEKEKGIQQVKTQLKTTQVFFYEELKKLQIFQHATVEKVLKKSNEKLQQQEEALHELQERQKLTQEELKKERSQVEELMEAQNGLENERSRISSELKALAGKREKELKDLQAAKQLLLQQKVALEGQMETIQAALEQEKKAHQSTRESITQSQQQHKAETDKMHKQLVLEAKAKEEVEKQKEEAEEKIMMQVVALNENVATLKRELQSSQRRVGELEKQTDELRGEIVFFFQGGGVSPS